MQTTLLADRYELGEPLGRGGMARVLAAYDRVLARQVAVKLLERDDVEPGSLERFLREARSAASLSHPNAVAVYDTGRDDDVAYLVMELVDGPSLQQELARRGAFQPAEAVRVVDALLNALAAAHARGLVHRDVKPGNVLLTRDGTVKLADFGIAKGIEARTDLTLPGQALGTPTYLSPEQAAGEPATPASDLYAVGVVLYELLAGEPPFTGDNPLAVALAHERDPVPSLLARRPSLSRALAGVVERALAKDPRDRFPSAQAMREALWAAPVGAPTPASQRTRRMAPPPPSPPPRRRVDPAPVPVQRGRRRRVEPWVAVSAIVLALMAITAGVQAVSDLVRGDGAGAAAPPAAEEPAPPVEEEAPAEPEEEPAPPAEEEPPAAPEEDRTQALLETEDLQSFLAVLAADPEAAGSRGPELAERLAEVVESGDAGDASQLAAQAATWVALGQLDRDVAEHAADLAARDAVGIGG